MCKRKDCKCKNKLKQNKDESYENKLTDEPSIHIGTCGCFSHIPETLVTLYEDHTAVQDCIQ